MTRKSEVLVPARFLLTVGHFVTVVLAFYNKDANVAAGLPGTTDKPTLDSASESVLAALGISIIAFAVQFYGLFSGGTMFMYLLAVMHCVCHFFGGVLTAWYVIDNWGYLSMWPIMVFFNLLPGLVEAAALCTTRRSRM